MERLRVLKSINERFKMMSRELFEFKDEEGQQFEYGERLAYTECLEWIQEWKYAKINGLDFDIEKRFPL